MEKTKEKKMSILSVSSLLQPLNTFGKRSDGIGAAVEAPKTDEAYILDLSDRKNVGISAEKSSVSGGMSYGPLLKSVQKQTVNVQDRLTRLLLSRNIDYSENIKFKIDDNGKIRVDGENAGKEAIEQVLNEDSEFSTELKRLLNDASDLAREEVRQKYQIALEDDENKDDEEKKLMLENKVIEINNQITKLSGSFSLDGGSLNIASLQFAAGVSF